MGKVADFFSAQGITLAQTQKRQMLALDQEFSDMESKIQILEAQNLKLQAQVNPLEREVDSLKKRIQREESAAIPEIAETILILIANNSGYVSGNYINATGLSGAQFQYHIDTLEEKGLAEVASISPRGTKYVATSKGLKYLASKKLI